MKRLLTLYFIISMMFASCVSTTTTPSNSSAEFQISKATIELVFITNDTDQLKVLMDAISKDLETESKFSEWNQKFSKEVKIKTLETYLNKGHQGL